MSMLTLILATLALLQAGPLEGARVLTPETRQHELAELALDSDPGKANPFNPNEIALDADVTTPSGRTLRVPGFWFQDYKRGLKNPDAKDAERIETLEAVGAPGWRLRFSSGETGVHKVVLELRTPAGVRKSAELRVDVKAGPRRGPIRVSPRNKMYLEDSGGKPYFPIGQNLCMYPAREGTLFFERILPKIAAAGGNYVRLWEEYYPQGDLKRPSAPGDGSNTGFPLETVPGGIGRYDMECAWRLDFVSTLLDRHQIGWQLCLENVVWWNRQFKHRWLRNPYNAEKGGPAVEPVDYLKKPECRELAFRRHRYSVARWGWSPNLVAWEMWNEVDNMDGFDAAANADWHKELCGKLKALDPWKHLITSSWRDAKMFSLPEIDLVQAHSYWPIGSDAAEYSVQDSDFLMRPYGKPFFFGEQGMNDSFDLDPEGKIHHDALWSSALCGAAGAGMQWYWTPVLDKFDLYRHYKGLSKFTSGEDWPARTWKAAKTTRPSQPVQLRVYGLVAEDRALLWIHDPLAFRVLNKAAQKGPAVTGASLNVAGLAEGAYRVEFVDTASGEVLTRDAQPVRPTRHFGHGIELNPPEFWGDIAVRIARRETK